VLCLGPYLTYFDRMAIEIGLNQPLPAGCDERASLNRTRTWLNCFYVDVSYATQLGKMPMISRHDHLARTSQNWYRSSALSSPFDIHLCACVDILHIFADFRAAVSEGNLRERVNEVNGFVILCYSEH
jgi:transcriptional regulatory protein LEU3